jgi:hypothetical protein
MGFTDRENWDLRAAFWAFRFSWLLTRLSLVIFIEGLFDSAMLSACSRVRPCWE